MRVQEFREDGICQHANEEHTQCLGGNGLPDDRQHSLVCSCIVSPTWPLGNSKLIISYSAVEMISIFWKKWDFRRGKCLQIEERPNYAYT